MEPTLNKLVGDVVAAIYEYEPLSYVRIMRFSDSYSLVGYSGDYATGIHIDSNLLQLAVPYEDLVRDISSRFIAELDRVIKHNCREYHIQVYSNETGQKLQEEYRNFPDRGTAERYCKSRYGDNLYFCTLVE